MVSAESHRTPQQKARFFIAIIPPPEVQAKVTQIKEYFRDRYNSQAALRSPPHITLQAPFEWVEADHDHLIMSLTEYQFHLQAIPIQLCGFGAFPPRVIYVNVEHTPALMALQSDLSEYLATRLGIIDQRSQTRPFHPHLTVAFRDLKSDAFRKAWSQFEQKEIQFSFCSTQIALLLYADRQWTVHQQFTLP